jgi:hypothetical protein
MLPQNCPSKALSMKLDLKRVFSKRVTVVLLIFLLALSLYNTYMIVVMVPSNSESNPISCDFILSQDSGAYKLKDMLTGYISTQTKNVSSILNAALTTGKSVYINPGTYVLDTDVLVLNKMNAKIAGDGATIDGQGHRIIVRGDDYTSSKYAVISGLTLVNCTVRVENSFGTTIQNVNFANSSTGIEFANTNTWSEYNKVEDCQFINDKEGIAFRTPHGNATGSYESSQIVRCSFNIGDDSVGVKVERLAEFSDCQIQDVRFWLGEEGATNQTAIYVDGAMDQTLLLGVVFESFAVQPNAMYAIDVGEHCNPAPQIASGVSFLGNWTAMVHNPYGKWLQGVSSAFQWETDVPVGLSSHFAYEVSEKVYPLRAVSFNPKIEVDGVFASGETVTVRIRIQYIDNTVTSGITKTFNATGSQWLSNDEAMELFPSQNIIWAILIDAQTNNAKTNVTVKVSGYGTAG